MMRVIIAEIGSSPAPVWDFDLWCSATKHAGATHIKAQMFYADHFPPAEQDAKLPLEFPRDRLLEFVETAHRYGLSAGVSVFDVEAVYLAARYCDFIKLAAREQYNEPLINNVHESSRERHIDVFRSVSSLTDEGCYFLPGWIHLYAVQSYPAGVLASAIALLAWKNYRRGFNRAWGWSSHTRGTLDCILAARLGASVIEKHLCLSARDIEAGHSLMPNQFAKMTKRIKGAR